MWAGMTGTERVNLVILEAEFFHFLDQGGTIHMQQVCRLALDPAGFHKGLHEELFFKRFDHGVKVDAVVWDADTGDTPGQTGAGDFLGEVFRHNHATPLQDGNAFHHIFEFAHIAGPVIALQHQQGFWGDTRQVLLFLVVEAGDKVRHQQRNVRKPFP